MRRHGRASAVAVGALAVLWGSNFLWIKVALEGMSPVQITLARLATGAAVLVAVVYARGGRLPSDPATVGHLVVAALFGNAAPYLLFAVGEQHVDSARAGVLSATTPLWTLLVAVTARQERGFGAARLAGIGLGFAGTLLVFQPWATDRGGGSLSGQAACLAAAACYGVSYVYMACFLTPLGLSPLVLSAGQLVAASLWLVPALALAGGGGASGEMTPAVWGAMVALGPIGTGVAYVLNYDIVGREGATAASVVTYLLPVVAVVLGSLVLDEALTVAMVGGTAVILAGVALARRQAAGSAGTAATVAARSGPRPG